MGWGRAARRTHTASVLVLGALAILCVSLCPAADVTPQGPRVEVTPRGGAAQYSGYLLGFKDGLVDVLLESGETRREKAGDVKSLCFVPPPAAVAPRSVSEAGKVEPPPANTGKQPGWSEADDKRLRELVERDLKGTLTPVETAEMMRLKEREPFVAHADVPRKRIENARMAAQHEMSKGRLDQYTAMLQQRLKHVTTEDEARDLVWRLLFTYTHKGQVLKVKELLQSDVETIPSPELRKQVVEEVGRILEWIAIPKPWRKDRDK